MREMDEVMGDCKICGRRMLTNGSPRVGRTCDACKAEQRRERNRKNDARRKAKRHAAKAKMAPPRCEQCGKVIEGATRLVVHPLKPKQWARKFCGNTCRQAAFRAYRASIWPICRETPRQPEARQKQAARR